MTEVKSPEVPAPPAAVPAELEPGHSRWHGVRPFLPLVALAVFAILPYSTVNLPGIFEGPLNRPHLQCSPSA
jgi:branched-chain amino acid transport system permease protein